MVLVANYETLEWVKRLGAPRVDVMLDLGIHRSLLADPQKKRRTDQNFVKILWTGRLLPRKGILLALEALAQVDPAVRFSCTIVGDGKQGHYLPGWIEQLGLSARVEWKGQVPWADALAAYLDHDVFLFTSLRDTAGSQLIEAMACGNAIITLDHQGARAVVPADAGIKVPVTAPNETVALIARAIERLAREPDTLAAMSRCAIEAAAEQTWERKIARAIALYPIVVQQHGAHG
jgi:glycosyltransferase involved in cell wall biosynthesis